MRLFEIPRLDLDDQRVLEEIHGARDSLRAHLGERRRWTSGLRRTTQARAIQGSNTIEGYTVTDQDAAAAVDHEEPLSADAQTWAEILGYRRVLTYVLNVATEPGFVIHEATMTSMHFMLLEHDLARSPGRYRSTDVYVHDDKGQTVYTGPDPDDVGGLMAQLVAELGATGDADPLVSAAMAHLNLVMIHPFRDGNGRMARALQAMVLARDEVVDPTFSSIEEWLGHNTDDYYRVLALTGQGAWNPHNDAHHWIKFNLRAHHMQAQTLDRRVDEAEQLWECIDVLVARHALPERVGDVLYDAMLGLRITRPSYVKRVEIEERTATRDLAKLVAADLLEPRGQTRGRFYVAGPALLEERQRIRRGVMGVVDPYPGLTQQIARRLFDAR